MPIEHPRVMNALMSRVWMLEPSKLEQVEQFVVAKLEGRDTATPDMAATYRSGVEDKPYQVRDGVAVIPVLDMLDRRMNLFMAFSGGTSTQILEGLIAEAALDDDVESILLDIDSPGGSVHGVDEVVQAIREAKDFKPVVAYSGGMLASGAYYIASHADQIVVSPNAFVGSIGVATVHYDYSEADKKSGVRRTDIYSGKYKRVATDTGPLTEEGKAHLQSITDSFYTVFVDTVAAGRGVSVDTVLSDMADARMFVGAQAVAAGLVDSIGNFNTALALARDRGGTDMSDPKKSPGAQAGAEQLTMETLRSEHPELVQSIEDEAYKLGEDEGRKAGMEEGRAAVIELVEAVHGEVVGGSLKQMVAAQITPAQIEAMRPVLGQGEKADEGKAQILAKLEQSDEGLKPAAPEKPAEPDTFDGAVAAHMREHSCTKGEAMKAVAQAQPELHEQWIKDQNK